ncbi:MAG: hypothetical protein WBM90_04925 [Acidimicrobiia bacterium]
MMAGMSEQTVESEITPAARMGKAILRGVAIGIPLSIVALTVAVWLITPNDWADSFATALLPGVLLGGFSGGFAGMAANMD